MQTFEILAALFYLPGKFAIMNLRICLLFIVLLNVMTVISPSALAQKAGDIYHKGWIDLNKNGRKDIYEDGAQPVNQRVNDLLRQMDLTEKEPGNLRF